MVLFTISVSAQDKYHIYAIQAAHWYGSNWGYEDLKEIDMTLTIQGKVVLINDKAHSSYYCYANNDATSFYAYDEKSRKCLIYFNNFSGYTCIVIMYDDFLIRYYYQ